MILVKNTSDVPKEKHYAVLIYKENTVYHEGDERSKTNPGHGYPAYTEKINGNEHYVTTNINDWIDFIKKIEEDNKKKTSWSKGTEYVALVVEKKATVISNITVGVE